MIKIYFVLFDKLALNFIENLIFYFLKNKKYSLVKLPRKVKKFTIIKAPHVHKKSKEHFEFISYKRLLIISFDLKKDVFLILSNLPNNVKFKVKYCT